MIKMTRFYLPLVLFVAVVGYLAIGLTKDPRVVPSPLIGKPIPPFSLPQLRDPEARLSSTDFNAGMVLLNVWATWCVSCRHEHETLLEVAKQIPIYGLNYKDDREAAIRWLDQLGDPYVATAFDQEGRVGIDFGVYGAPETYLIDGSGVIVYKLIGPMTPDIWNEELLPLVSTEAKPATP
jgi:cytochrome c biogenesis protein CcmG, thiol:disulfide interchange protein DsbE